MHLNNLLYRYISNSTRIYALVYNHRKHPLTVTVNITLTSTTFVPNFAVMKESLTDPSVLKDCRHSLTLTFTDPCFLNILFTETLDEDETCGNDRRLHIAKWRILRQPTDVAGNQWKAGDDDVEMLKMNDEGVWRVMTTTTAAAAAAALGVLTGTPRWHAIHHVTRRSGHICRCRRLHRRRSIFWNAIHSANDNDDDYDDDDDDDDNNNFQDNVYSVFFIAKSLREFNRFIWWMENSPKRRPTIRRVSEWVCSALGTGTLFRKSAIPKIRFSG